MKKILLIGGGGTLGCYTYLEMLKLGYSVDVIALEDLVSANKNLRFIKARVSDELLSSLFAENRYDAIVDFIHYPDPEQYKSRARLLLDNTSQLIFLSSYRTYADAKDGVVREDGARLLDTVKDDEYFIQNEDYALPKSREEDFLRSCGKNNFTIIRPLISFSHYRLDLVTVGANILLSRSAAGKPILLPKGAKDAIAGVGWAGNVGKMTAHLVGKEGSLRQAYTLGTDENKPWSYVADCYTELLGAKFKWIDNAEYLRYGTPDNYPHHCMLYYDRLYNRRMDVSKILEVTGIDRSELVMVYEGIVTELDYIAQHPKLYDKFMHGDYTEMMNERIDSYFRI